jgi:hypothetical protein
MALPHAETGAMKILERYADAVHSHRLVSDPATTYSDTDVLGAMGLAGKARPLAAALLRLFAGDDRSGAYVIAQLAMMAWRRAQQVNIKLKRTQADEMARSVLDWYRNPACKPCGGLGYMLIPGTPHISDHECPACSGTGRRPIERAFPNHTLPVARWLIAEVEREQASAGQAAMRKLAPRLEF